MITSTLLSALVEKDYWIMHCPYGLSTQGLSFELKGGTSLSKGFGIIQHFSEDSVPRSNPEAVRRIIGWQHEAFAYDRGHIIIPYVIYSGLSPGKYNIYHVQDILLDSCQIYCYLLSYGIITGLKRW
jgi:hypothetical protein